MDDIDFEALSEQLAKIDPEELRYLLQLLSENAPVVKKIVQNALDEPTSEETQKSLQPPLLPKPFQPRAPPRQRRTRKRQELLREFDPFRPQNIRTVTDYQNEILNLYDVASYLHAILYDFEAYGDNNQRKEPTPTLTIDNAHVPISVSIGDTLEREPTHICERDPAELLRKFMEELERRGKNIRAQVRADFMPEDANLLPKAQRQKIEEWCNQVPVVGFNSGTYDLNLIKKHFAEHLADDTAGKVRVAKNGNKIMFWLTWGFSFLEIINYLGPGTSYEKWVKAYEW